MQCVAICCVAVCCNVLRSLLQQVAVCCGVLQCAMPFINTSRESLKRYILQFVVVCCVAVYCSVLRCVSICSVYCALHLHIWWVTVVEEIRTMTHMNDSCPIIHIWFVDLWFDDWVMSTHMRSHWRDKLHDSCPIWMSRIPYIPGS